MSLIDAMIAAGAATSRRDARQLIDQGSVQLNGAKVAATDAVLHVADAVDHDFSILKKGKRNYFVLDFKK